MGALLPLFLACVAGAAYAFQKRRADLEAIRLTLEDMRHLTSLALETINGSSTQLGKVREYSMRLITRIRLEMLHRPEYVQQELKKITEKFLEVSEITDGRRQATPEEVFEYLPDAETALIQLLRQLTVLDALRQAWLNPGLHVSLDNLLQRVKK